MFNRKQLNKMIIKVKEQIERELEITFPCSFKKLDGTGSFAHFNSEEDNGTVIRECIKDISTCKISNLGDLPNYIPCEKSEVEAAFNRVIKHYKTNVFGITVDLNSNTPTEVLEKFERQSESVEMKHDFNK